jgi:hypothetical protein
MALGDPGPHRYEEDEIAMRSQITAYFKAGCRRAASLWLLLLFVVPPALAAGGPEAPDDEFLTGYVAAILERDLHWERDSYRLTVVGGVATITLLRVDAGRREAAEKELRAIDGLKEVVIAVAPADGAKPGAGSGVGEKPIKGRPFPSGDLFRPLLADPKQPQFYVSVDSFRSLGVRSTMTQIGFGETFGMYRWFSGGREGDGLQMSVEASLDARFNMSTPSHNLINADYTVGTPLTYRSGDSSFRLRIYHQSSHLGDEFLLSPNPPKRINLSFESVEFLYSREWRGWRGYLGGEYLFDQDPADRKPGMVHWGIEYRGSRPLLGTGRLVGGADFKCFEEQAWAVNTSVKVGLEFGQPSPGHRRLRLMAEWYRGYDPRGQFYMNRVEYYGLDLSLGF